jgi:hypothetical protein
MKTVQELVAEAFWKDVDNKVTDAYDSAAWLAMRDALVFGTGIMPVVNSQPLGAKAAADHEKIEQGLISSIKRVSAAANARVPRWEESIETEKSIAFDCVKRIEELYQSKLLTKDQYNYMLANVEWNEVDEEDLQEEQMVKNCPPPADTVYFGFGQWMPTTMKKFDSYMKERTLQERPLTLKCGDKYMSGMTFSPSPPRVVPPIPIAEKPVTLLNAADVVNFENGGELWAQSHGPTLYCTATGVVDAIDRANARITVDGVTYPASPKQVVECEPGNTIVDGKTGLDILRQPGHDAYAVPVYVHPRRRALGNILLSYAREKAPNINWEWRVAGSYDGLELRGSYNDRWGVQCIMADKLSAAVKGSEEDWNIFVSQRKEEIDGLIASWNVPTILKVPARNGHITLDPAPTGATCCVCNTHNEYAEGGPGWKCYGCRSGV